MALKKYPIDIFKNIDNQYKAYFLGFMYADGCVIEAYNDYSAVATLGIHTRDYNDLVILSNKLFGENLVKITTQDRCRLRLHKQETINDLVNWGVVPRKTFLLDKLPAIDDSLMNHFIRGYFDGDGCITKYKNSYRLNIIGTEKFCINLNKYILYRTGESFQISDKCNDITKSLSTSGNIKIAKILSFIYLDAEVYLSRKRNKYLELLKISNKSGRKSGKIVIPNEVLDSALFDIQNGLTYRQAAVKYNYDKATLHKHLAKYIAKHH